MAWFYNLTFEAKLKGGCGVVITAEYWTIPKSHWAEEAPCAKLTCTSSSQRVRIQEPIGPQTWYIHQKYALACIRLNCVWSLDLLI